MTPEQVFGIVNPLALLAWITLAVAPKRTASVTGVVVPAIFATLYVVLLATFWRGTDGGFETLDAVARLFANRWLLLAGWVHYLCFDLLVGTWEVRDAQARGVPHWLVLPCLALTFLFGPAGWLLYKGLSSRFSSQSLARSRA
jgi:hypothetical protein